MNTTPTDNIPVLELRSDGRNPNSARIQKWMPALYIANIATLVGLLIWFFDAGRGDLLIISSLGPSMVFEWLEKKTHATLTITDTHISARCPLLPRWLSYFRTHHWDIAFSDIESIAFYSRKPSPNTYATWTSQQLQLTLRNGMKKIISPAMWFVPESPAKRLLITGLETLPLVTVLRSRGLHVPPLDSVAGPPDVNELTSPAVKWFLGASFLVFLLCFAGAFFTSGRSGNGVFGNPLAVWIFIACSLAGCMIFGWYAAHEKPRAHWRHVLITTVIWCAVMLLAVCVFFNVISPALH